MEEGKEVEEVDCIEALEAQRRQPRASAAQQIGTAQQSGARPQLTSQPSQRGGARPQPGVVAPALRSRGSTVMEDIEEVSFLHDTYVSEPCDSQ